MSRDFWWSQWLAHEKSSSTRPTNYKTLQNTIPKDNVQFGVMGNSNVWVCQPLWRVQGVKVQCNARKEGWSVGGSSWVSTSDHGSKVWHKVVHHLRSPTLVEWGDVWCEVYMYVWEMREGEVAIKHNTQAINHTQNIHTWRTKLSTLSKKRRVWWVRTPTFYLERS